MTLTLSLRAVRMRFSRTGNIRDLHAAISAAQRAIDLTPPGHPDLADCQSLLGDVLLARFRRTGRDVDLNLAIGYWQNASANPTGWPDCRLGTAIRWGAAAARGGRPGVAADGYTAGVELLPMVAWHGLGRGTRQDHLARWAGLASDAAACAVQAGRFSQAVELLELGRTVLWTQALNLRGDLSYLAEQHAMLADRLNSIRSEFDTASPFETLLQEVPWI